MAKAKRASSSTLWHEDESVVENPQAPSIRRSLIGRSWARRALYVIAFAGVPLTMAIFVNNVVNPAPIPVAPSLSAASLAINGSLGKTAAVEAVEAWLATAPQPVPGGRVSSWDGFETVKKPVAVNDKQKITAVTYDVEIHHFTITTGTGASLIAFTSEVEVLVDKTLGAKVTTTPTLIPRAAPATTTWTSVQTWLGLQQADTPKPVTDAVNAWSAAFTSGKPEVLRLAVGDPNAGHAYIPLTGLIQATTAITSSAPIPLANPDAKSTQMLVRVTMTVVWQGQSIPEKGTSTAALPLITYDLLVDGSDTAAPRVVSWGGPGSGPSLTPYSTAINGLDVTGASPTTAPAAASK